MVTEEKFKYSKTIQILMGRQRRLKAERRSHRVSTPQKKTSYKKYIAIGAFSVIGLGFGVYLANDYLAGKNVPVKESKEAPTLEMAVESQLNSARKDFTKRQAYLDNLLMGITIPHCSEVVYDHDGSKILDYIRAEMVSYSTPKKESEGIMRLHEQQFKGGYYDAKMPEILELSGMNRNSKIFLGRRIFEDFVHLTDEEIKHMIVAHEGRHTIQHAKGLGYIDKNLLIDGVANGLIEKRVVYEIAELDANYHGLKRILSGEFKVSREYFEATKRHYYLNRARLENVLEESSAPQKRFIKAAFDNIKDLDLRN